MPIYIHPTFPTYEMTRALYKVRLHATGVFDRFQNLKIIIGHNRELLPYQLGRIDGVSKRWVGKAEAGLRALKIFKEAWDDQIWVTTSGMFDINPLACLVRNIKIERIMYSVDWPFSQNTTGWEFLHELKDSGLLKEGDIEKIAYKNAEQLLRLRATQ